ncbi:hypothetical protein JQ582_08540 [Bradyrhizobium japonicum]|jgi:hypothetical protein|uniref:Uncharacterized protein n=1 Tax=Bradyrhizobium japonicum TaxID=375 RepID=A0ABV2S1G7_BRAJP|nr:hypothetical protein [Bradyrhizobium japonicum]AHY51597.1 hypothetical protein BJS_06849 [Bradyrhizobium japonicum SEMIA 5079]AJA64137.1 hypothetical protein RN69_30350 [Bradyrhizobium japonicum]KMJ98213.1 hypothetical protein CF64_18230 [Bradyrhizobium japonicum]MBR0727622.1 hypothetical protein [Bradyrhizobium japonicum]MBR0743970.1 hypothetical protein [Bradyrhizobium japonicum]
MSSVGIQVLMLPLAGIHLAMTYHEVTGVLEIARALGHSYRLASSDPGSGALHGRFILDFCRTVVTANNCVQ